MPAVACTPGNGYGVTVRASRVGPRQPERVGVAVRRERATDVAVYPDGAWFGTW